MMRINTKNPSLDQTGGPRDVEKERSQSQQALQRTKLPGALASQHKGLNLDKRRQAKEVYKATTDQLDWVNPEGQQNPHNLLKPLTLIPKSRGCRVIPFDHFFNNDLEYLCGGASSRKYTTSVTKTKAADYGHIKWIEDLVPRTMWIQEPTIWRKSDKERAAAMIQAIDKKLKTMTIMRSLERFVGGRLYEETSGCFKGPYDLSYVVLTFQK
nr:hypothetical protein [Tanacetum cinerariifolium]